MSVLAKRSFILLIVLVFFLGIEIKVYAEGEWKREFSVGYSQSSGNTEKADLSITGDVKRIMTDSELQIKGDIYYSSADKKMDSQKWLGMLRYTHDFGKDKRWFRLYRLVVDHDRFSDIDYRITPAAGLGYWFFKEEDFKLELDGSLGYQITEHRSSQPDDEEVVFIAHSYLEKKIFENAIISEDLSVIPSLEGGGVIIKSESAFINPINNKLDLSVKFIVDYDSDPASGVEETDTRIVTGLKYSF